MFDERPVQSFPVKIRQTAIHESGHAVVARSFGWRLKTISIVPRNSGEEGHVEMHLPSICTPKNKTSLAREARQIRSEEICILLSGQAAVRRMWGEESPMRMARNDFNRVMDLLDLLGIHAPQRALMWAALEAEAEHRLAARWDAVEGLAEQLLARESFSGREAWHFLRSMEERRAAAAREAQRVPVTEAELQEFAASQHDLLLSLLPAYVAAAFHVSSREVSQ